MKKTAPSSDEKTTHLTVDTSRYPVSLATKLLVNGARSSNDLYTRLRECGITIDRDTLPKILAPLANGDMGTQLLQLVTFLNLAENGRTTAEKRTGELFNHRLLTHNPDGSLNYVLPQDISPLFPQGHEEVWPNLLLTTNHARATNHFDISGMMEGFTQLAEDAHAQTLNRAPFPYEPDSAKGKTITLATCYALGSTPDNGVRVQNRRNNLQMYQPPKPSKVVYPSPITQHGGISPASVELAKLMLSLMVTEPERVQKHFSSYSNHQTDTAKSEGELARLDNNLQKPRPLILRADASRIASRIMLAGYSMGGNSVSDAMRFLLYELTTNERPLTKGFLQIQEENGTIRNVERKDIKRIASSIGVLAVSSGELPLTPIELELGMRRLNVVSQQDMAVGHYTIGREKGFQPMDDLFIITGTHQGLGHHPDHALMGDDDTGMDKGYLLNNARVKDRIKVMTATLFNHPALEHFNEISKAAGSPRNEHTFALTFNPGTLRSTIAHLEIPLGEELRNVMQDERIGVQITEQAPSALRITMPDELVHEKGSACKMAEALHKFCDDNAVVFPAYLKEDIMQFIRVQRETGRILGSHSERMQRRSEENAHNVGATL